MSIQEKVAEILQIDPSRINLNYRNKKDFSIDIYYDFIDKYMTFADVIDGNIIHISQSNEDSQYQKIFNASDKSIYDNILVAFAENKAIIEKYNGIIKNERRTIISMGKPYFYYNKRSKKLYALPTIIVNTISSRTQFQLPPSILNKIDKVVNSIHEQFYNLRLIGFLEKPLNLYTEDELTLLHMTKI